MNNLQNFFKEIRDIPYSIPLSYGAEDRCCTGKHKKLLEALKENGYEVRWRVCTFKWSDLPIPQDVSVVPHDDNSTHVYLEVMIEGAWKKVDVTWDKGISSALPVNEWDGVSDTPIAVPVISVHSPEESLVIVEAESKEVVEADLRVNGKFYDAFNRWLQGVRATSVSRQFN